MAPQSSPYRVKRPKAKWSMTVMMNARDLSRDDDFLSHLLVEHLGTDDAPLQVHKMDPSRRLPKHDPGELMAVLKKYIIRKGGASTVVQRIKRAVDALLDVPAVKEYLHKRSTAQINAFATHASRYFELYLPAGSIEISHTSRYSHRTGKSELCILATAPLKVGQVITDLKGSLAHLTPEEDEELRRTDTRRRDGRIRRDFSVIHSNQKNKSHLFLGPARFVNHDCDHNVELFREGRIITFRVIKPVAVGQEVTAHYGDGYFGKGNRHCLCQTCERLARGGYAPIPTVEVNEMEDDSSTDEETREKRVKTCLGLTAKGNPNERRTRRGVYAILAEEDTDDEEQVATTEIAVSNAGQSLLSESANSVQDVQSPSPSNLLSGNTPRRRLSDASSSLTSLSDIEKPPEKSTEINGAHSLSRFSLSSLSSLESLSPGPKVTPQSTTTTASTSRRTTRASIALQDKDKVPGSRSDCGITTRPDSPRGHDTRFSRNSTVTPESGLSDGLNGAGKRFLNGNGNTRPINLNISKSAETRHVSPSKSLSKSATPVSNQPPEQKQTSGPKCETCFADLPQFKPTKHARISKRSCARCKRHFAIYGSLWPNRIAALEPLSSDPESDSDLELGKGKDKYGKKSLLMEPLLKRRKTDSVLFVSAAKVTQGEYYGQYGKVAKPLTSKFFDPTVAHRYLANRALSKESSALTLGVKRKWEEMETEAEYREMSLRIMASFAGFPVAKPLPGLSAKPSPILFARSAWTTTAFVDDEAKRERAISQSTSILENIRDPSALPGSSVTGSTSLAPPLISPTTGQKRKCDSLLEDKDKYKERAGKAFYMTGKKKMPKGWILLSSSSEEEEIEVQEDGGKAAAADKIEGPLEYTDQAPEPQTTSNQLPWMSEAHTQRLDEPFPIHAMNNLSIEASPVSIDKHHAEGNTTVISSPKLPSEPLGQLTPKNKLVTGMSTDNDKSPCTRSRTKRESAADKQPASVVSKLDFPADSPPDISYSGTTSESSLVTEQNDIANDKPPGVVSSELQNIVVSSWKMDAQISPTVVYNPDNKYPAVMEFGTLKEPDTEAQRVALETSNYIHGTAFSFGHPDPRTSWKPKYSYSEVGGWLSDSE